ncbi:MAG TPA: class I SAM-dependent methyltransferase [Bacteroidales bacterium]|nr:class I SAM-dependent methyltransferase [Bacteroidales bacterium]
MDKKFCPVCKTNSWLLSTLDQSFLKEQYQLYFNVKEIPEEVTFLQYTIYNCPNCSLTWSDPLVGGDDDFYKWISGFKIYYPSYRWEFNKIKDLLFYNENLTLLDVGCGSGIFIEYLRNNSKIDCLGIDPNENSINEGKKRGLKVIKTNLHDLPTNLNFDVIVSNHVLEHLPDPVDFINTQKKYLKIGGRIFISTPLSPMSFETDWFDPLNYPPHHLTRWTLETYNKLAEVCNCSIEIHLPAAANLLNRTLIAFGRKRHLEINRKVLIKNVLVHPSDFVKQLWIQSRRKQYNNMVLPDSVLVALMPK